MILDKDFYSIKYTVLDFETTGLSVKKDEFCEIGAVHIYNKNIQETFHTLVNPLKEISPQAQKINKITNDMVKNAPLTKDVLPDLIKFIGDSVIVAHNVFFDMEFLQNKLIKLNLPILTNTVVDTLTIARNENEFGKNNLEYVADRYGIKTINHHRALDDAITTAKIFLAYLEKFSNNGANCLRELPGVHEQYIPGISSQRKKFDTPFLDKLEKAINKGEKLKITYCDSKNQITHREVCPEFLNNKFLVAFCYLRYEKRNFRLDRIRQVKCLQKD